MKVAYKHLINFLNEKPSIKLLSEKLFQLGHEHEINGDIFDMELTPNRGDCLSLKGLARDLNVFFGSSEAPELYEDDIEVLEIDFKNLSPKDCPKISFLEIEIEKQEQEYKTYLENYFSFLGINKTNLFTDISNYISYELGQPTHCFDAEKINHQLVFKKQMCDFKFKTLLGSEVKLEDYNCVFLSGDNIISLAGVMGGESTACSSETKKVIVECAYFNPESIIGKSIKYNITSDAAYKFERGVDVLSHEQTIRRFIKIVQDHAKVKSIKFKTFTSSEYEHLHIPVDVEKVNKILGTKLRVAEYVKLIRDLGMTIIDEKIKIPSYRHDINTHNDLAEEVARVIGYDNIVRNSIMLHKISNPEEINKVALINSFLIQNGFNEVINFPFTSKENKESITIDNPLDSNRKYFRTSMKYSLVENLLYNERRQEDSIKLFEISDIYVKHSKIRQQKRLAIIASGRCGNNYKDFSKRIDYEYLNKLLNVELPHKVFHINEIPRNELDTKKKDRIFYVEISLDDIPELFFSNINEEKKVINFVQYKPISEFPSSTRDFSFSITDLSRLEEVVDILNRTSDPIIKHSFIFDFYKNEKTATVKLGYRFIFQSHLKTLSDEEISKKVKDIIGPIIKLNGVSIPGMSLENA